MNECIFIQSFRGYMNRRGKELLGAIQKSITKCSNVVKCS